MNYRRLGRAGIKVSELSFGSWVTFGPQIGVGEATEILGYAYEQGVNFFDNAEAYSSGESERIMGAAIAQLGWPRHSYLVSSKFYWGIHDTVNARFTLNRKYLIEAVNASLERFGLDHLDLIYCHRPDAETPIEETVYTMHELVAEHKAHYWGTSEWSADEIRAAIAVAREHHLHAPVVEQPEYNMLTRAKVEVEYKRLLDEEGIGLTTWSPLASGLLTGKYANGIPAGSRASLPGYEWLKEMLTDPKSASIVKQLEPIAKQLDLTMGQLAIGWCLANPQVSTVILGASNRAQLEENLGAQAAHERLTPEIQDNIRKILEAK